jgi:hypothetical protein
VIFNYPFFPNAAGSVAGELPVGEIVGKSVFKKVTSKAGVKETLQAVTEGMVSGSRTGLYETMTNASVDKAKENATKQKKNVNDKPKPTKPPLSLVLSRVNQLFELCSVVAIPSYPIWRKCSVGSLVSVLVQVCNLLL